MTQNIDISIKYAHVLCLPDKAFICEIQIN